MVHEFSVFIEDLDAAIAVIYVTANAGYRP
jgi:hypothetical protein